MSSRAVDRLLDRLEGASRERGGTSARDAARLLARLGTARIADAPRLIRLHELLLFLRAYPHDRAVLAASEVQLASFHQRVARLLSQAGFDPYPLVRPEVSGIAGTLLSIDHSYDMVRQLAAEHGRALEIDWEVPRGETALAAVVKCLSPAFADAGYVEYPIPTQRWIERVKARSQTTLAWLLERLAGWQIPARERAALYDAIRLYVAWRLGNSRASRTRNRIPSGPPFFHPVPLLRRGEVAFAEEAARGPRLAVRRLARSEGAEFLARARDAMAVRSRELDGFLHGDPRTVVRAEAGRGVVFYLWGLPPAWRLPLLAYHAGLIVKNGVPCGYTESLGFFERSEVGLNLFYSFRDGESAWIYARLLRLVRQVLGLTVISVDPYQIGHHNEEAIDSGAFWFYRKLGFRPVVPELARRVEAEERKIAADPSYRTSKATLRKLAAGHLLFEAPGALEPGAWDAFRIGDLALLAERNAATHAASSPLELVLAGAPGLDRWSEEEARALAEITRAKCGSDETRYLRLLQRHTALRRELLELAARPRPGRGPGFR